MADVFISYARATAPQAQTVASALRGLGYSVWIDGDLPAHRTYSQVIEEQLSLAKATLVIWSADAIRSEWVMSEANRAREDGKLVQVTLDPIRLPMPFDQIHCADLAGWSGEVEAQGWRTALASIADLVGEHAAGRSSTVSQAPVAAPRAAAESERRHLTFLSCHLASAAGLAADLDPEEWQAITTQRQREATATAARLGGHVTRAGDGLMVYFGYPQAQEDAAERAVRAGLAIVEAMAGLDAGAAPASRLTLSVRIGIHAGTVVVTPGDGAAGKAEMFGQPPRIATLVEAAAAPNTVVMTDAVHDLVSGLFAVEDLGARALDGAEEATRLYRVVRAGLASGRTRGFAPRELTPFVGRDDEIHLFLSRWRRVQDGEGQLVLATGEPGIGKTRVTEEFRARIRAEPHLWIECAGAPLFANTPFHAVIQMFNQGLGWRGDEDAVERVSRLEQALAPTELKLDEAVPLIAEMLGLPVPPTYPPLNLAPDQRRVRLLSALAGWVFGATRTQPLVIVIEDMQWVDPSTLELVQTLVEQGATAPLMLLLTARPEFRPTWPAREHHAQITLSRLNNRQTRELVAGVASKSGLSKDVVEAVIRRTDGVPLFAEELTRLMLDGDAHNSAREIPATLLDSLAARLDRLGSAKEVAQVASVIGREFTYELLEAVSQMPEADLRSGLTRLADAELIYARGLPPQASYQFKHALIQDAAYERLLKSKRQTLHARVAQTINERFAALAEAQPEVIALHWTRAGQAEPAVAAWKIAGDTAYGRRAFKEAEGAYRQGLAVLDTQPDAPERDAKALDLYSGLNRALQLTRGYAAPETVEAASKARSLAEKSGSIAQLIREEARLWRAVITSGDHAGASAIADHILDLAHAEGDNPGRLVFVHNAQVQTRFYTGDLAGVETHFALLSPLIDTVGKRQAPGNNIVAIGIASLTAWAFGHAELAHARMDRALAFAEESQNPYDLAMALHFQGNLYERDPDRAEAIATRMRAVSEENSFSYLASLALVPLGWARAQKGAAAEGVELIARTLTDQVASGARVSIAATLNRLAEAQALNGAAPEALATIEEALTANPQELVYRPESFRIRGTLRAKQGESALAEADFREAIRLSQVMGAIAFELRAAVSLAHSLQRRGEAITARALLAPLYARFTDGLEARDLTEAKALLDELSA
ncbi:AAA family ATPase [Phenylobacterium sp.]|uniref:AAA family ATPase n=1 Tax=Phenylobacterium sp. TaxID=1871053 RepID=UPI00286B14DD|nr:AAA family ATPase [Phenylobacterium sp.]